jgi:hypothetical protein
MNIKEAEKILDNIALDWKYAKPVRYEALQTLKNYIHIQQANNTNMQQLKDEITDIATQCSESGMGWCGGVSGLIKKLHQLSSTERNKLWT